MTSILLNIKQTPEYQLKTKQLTETLMKNIDKIARTIEQKEKITNLIKKDPNILTDIYYFYYTQTPVIDPETPRGKLLTQLLKEEEIEETRQKTINNETLSRLYTLLTIQQLVKNNPKPEKILSGEKTRKTKQEKHKKNKQSKQPEQSNMKQENTNQQEKQGEKQQTQKNNGENNKQQTTNTNSSKDPDERGERKRHINSITDVMDNTGQSQKKMGKQTKSQKQQEKQTDRNRKQENKQENNNNKEPEGNKTSNGENKEHEKKEKSITDVIEKDHETNEKPDEKGEKEENPEKTGKTEGAKKEVNTEKIDEELLSEIRKAVEKIKKEMGKTNKILREYRRIASHSHSLSLSEALTESDYLEIIRFLQSNPLFFNQVKKILALSTEILSKTPHSHRTMKRDKHGSEMMGYTIGRNPLNAIPKELADKELYDAKILTGFTSREKGYPAEGSMYILLDQSFSMTGLKNTWARALTIALLIHARQKKQKVKVRFFDDKPRHLFDSKDKNMIYKILATGMTGGGTNFTKALLQAINDLKQENKEKNKIKNLIMITDGEDYMRNQTIKELYKQLQENNIRFTIIQIPTELETHAKIIQEQVKKPTQLLYTPTNKLIQKITNETNNQIQNLHYLETMLNLAKTTIATGGAIYFVKPDKKTAVKLTKAIDMGARKNKHIKIKI